MNVSLYLQLKKELIRRGYQDEIKWSENIKPCQNSLDFFCEYAWVVINSGMKNQVAQVIWDRVKAALAEGKSVYSAFKHQGKSKAIQYVWENQERLFEQYLDAEDKMAYLESIPWIGGITKYHLAKNLGFDCCKPDRHLVRISKEYNTSPEELCKRISEATGDRVATVDLVIWRVANLGLI